MGRYKHPVLYLLLRLIKDKEYLLLIIQSCRLNMLNKQYIDELYTQTSEKRKHLRVYGRRSFVFTIIFKSLLVKNTRQIIVTQSVNKHLSVISQPPTLQMMPHNGVVTINTYIKKVRITHEYSK